MSASKFRIVEDAVNGKKEVGEQVFGAIAALEERLEHIHALGGDFAAVEFSEDVRELIESRSLAAVN